MKDERFFGEGLHPNAMCLKRAEIMIVLRLRLNVPGNSLGVKTSTLTSRLSKKVVISHLIRDLHPLKWEGDTGSGSGMTKLIALLQWHDLFGQPQWKKNAPRYF